MDYFAGLDISMDETHVCVLDCEGMVVREKHRQKSTAQAVANELAKSAELSSHRIRDGADMALILSHGLGANSVCPWSAWRAGGPIRRSSRLRLTRPIAVRREDWRIWLAPGSSSPCM